MAGKVLLNNGDHADLRVAVRHGAAFGDNVNQMLLFPSEFEEAQREYPIFFRRDEQGAFQAVALLGLDRDENLFLGPDGWTSRYVPAIQARGPFSIGLQQDPARDGDPEPMIHVDLDDPRVGAEDGFPLFLPHGGQAPHLDRVIASLKRIYAGLRAAGPMFAAFEESGLIEQVAVEITIADGRQYSLPDYFAISEERLATLDAAALERLHRGGFLRAAILAAASLGNVDRLIEAKSRRLAAGG